MKTDDTLGNLPHDSAQAYRQEAARKIQTLIYKHVEAQNPFVSNDDALALVDAFTLAAIKGLEQYLTRPMVVAPRSGEGSGE